LAGAVVVLVVSERQEDAVPEIIRAQKIEIVGEDGVTRVALGETLEGAGAVATYDSRGEFVAALDPSVRRSGLAASGPANLRSALPQRGRTVHAAAAIRASQR
jgi:hypothetical protein